MSDERQSSGPSMMATCVIAILGLINLGRGSLHLFLPDSGAGVIAGLDLGAGRAAIVSLLAAVGVGQLGMALVDFTAVFFQRALVRPLLFVHTLMEAGAVFLLFYWKPLPTAVPGQWGALAGFIVLGLITAIEISRAPAHAKT
ncbi:MAG: hypothetical protein GC190_06605 [Alphaproteobacteria bacterium]|nr:hypothetical protein [Alphaproteobacteria bacterium]